MFELIDFMSESIEKPRHKRGDVREDGMVFWGYSSIWERWCTQEEFELRKAEARERERTRREKNPDAGKAAYYRWKAKQDPEEFKAKAREKAKEYYRKDIEKSRERNRKVMKERRKKSPEIVRAKARARYAKQKALDPESIRKRAREYMREKRKTDVLFALKSTLRCRISRAFRDSKMVRPSGLGRLLGATLEEAKAHIEAQFQPGMSWENRGSWHIDHIIPLASAKTEDELIALCHYTNLQPLWAKDNISKGAKMPSVALDTKPANK